MANPIAWTIDKIKNFNEIVWYTQLSKLTKRRTFLLRQIRIICIAVKGFVRDNVQIQASALTLNTLLSVIPVAAIVFAIAKGFGLERNLEEILTRELSSHQEILQWLLDFAQNALNETRGGYLAGVGAVILIWSVVSLLNNIENSFNHIWQVSNSRSWGRKLTDYLTIVLITPVLMVLSGSITVFVGTTMTDFISSSSMLGWLKPVVGFLIKSTPYVLTWVVLTIIFMVLPNTKVKFMPALVAGIIAGTFFKLLQWLYIDMQMGITKLSAIYGSFAAIPLFIIWLQASWLVILLGAELSFANQNVSQYEQEAQALNVSSFQKRSLTLMLMHRIVANFAQGLKPISAGELAQYFELPIRLVRDILKDLHDINLISIVHAEDEEKENLYQPALDINKITVGSVITKLDRFGSEHRIEIKDKEYNTIVGLMKKAEKMIGKSDLNILIKDI